MTPQSPFYFPPPAEIATMQCKTCKKYIPKCEIYSDFYYCKYCEETFDNDTVEIIEDDEIEDAEID